MLKGALPIPVPLLWPALMAHRRSHARNIFPGGAQGADLVLQRGPAKRRTRPGQKVRARAFHGTKDRRRFSRWVHPRHNYCFHLNTRWLGRGDLPPGRSIVVMPIWHTKSVIALRNVDGVQRSTAKSPCICRGRVANSAASRAQTRAIREIRIE